MTAAAGVGIVLLLVTGCAGGSADSDASPTVEGTADSATRDAVAQAARESMQTYHLKSLIIRVTSDGEDVYTAAMGESMTGVPATPDMHFRSGSMAFTYIGQIFAELVDAGEVSLDDPLSDWFPEYPRAAQITIKNLLNMTSGYADYVYQPALGDSLNRDPFKQWTNEELLQIGFAGPEQFAPGTNWGYSHTNYVILGQVLEKITGKPLDEVMQEYIIGPMGLTATSDNAGTPAIPSPVQHSFTAERAEYFGVTPTLKAYEEGTFWNPSWTTANGAVQTTNIYDMTTSMEIVGSGAQVSPEMYQAQTGANLIGFGGPDPTGVCTVCRTNTEARSYGLGVIRMGPWITQTKSFAGAAASTGYLPSDKLAVSVAMTYLPAAYAEGGELNSSSLATFSAVVDAVAPGKAPPKVE
jgi:CubicO group peptidase (beta-lactamase class C family)